MLKSDNTYFNENDFVETNGCMQELTVTITLNEYRTLIQDNENNLNLMEKLEAENERLNNLNAEYVKLILDKCPELKDKTMDIIEVISNKTNAK